MAGQKDSTKKALPKAETALSHLKAARETLEKVGQRHMRPGSLASANTHFENALIELQAHAIESK